jgi:hypothetical protein
MGGWWLQNNNTPLESTGFFRNSNRLHLKLFLIQSLYLPLASLIVRLSINSCCGRAGVVWLRK